MQFRAFFACMLAHQEYYQPFLEATGVDVERSQAAIQTAKANIPEPQHKQQQQQQQPADQQQQQRTREDGQASQKVSSSSHS